MSTGSFVLADAGLLTDRRCTVHWEYADWFQSRYPSIALSRDLYVVDRNIFTCSGGTAALDMMLHFVAQAAGAGIATAVAEQFIHSQIRSQRRPSAPGDARPLPGRQPQIGRDHQAHGGRGGKSARHP